MKIPGVCASYRQLRQSALALMGEARIRRAASLRCEDPGRVLLVDEALDALGEQWLWVRNRGVRAGAREEQEFLVFEPLAGGPIGGPVLLLLLELLEAAPGRRSARHCLP